MGQDEKPFCPVALGDVKIVPLTRQDVREAVLEALRCDEGQNVIVEAVAKKLEITAGWNCADPKERLEIRKDQEYVRALRIDEEEEAEERRLDQAFLRTLRKTAGEGAKRSLYYLIGAGGILLLSYIGSHQNIWK